MSDRAGEAAFYALLLILPLSALFARRVPLGRVALLALVWAGIFGIGLLAVAIFSGAGLVGSGVHRLVYGGGQHVVGREVRVPMAQDGHFYVEASINGVVQTMLVDSGATMTALSVATARAAGAERTREAFPMILETANGSVTADRMTIAHLRIGTIEAADLGAAVSPAFGEADVLGMNFLSRLSGWRVAGRTLVLQP